MSTVVGLGTCLPRWGTSNARTLGRDEDAVTLAVAAARAALSRAGDTDIVRVVLVTRDLPLLDGGNGAALLAGAGLPAGTAVVEQIGGPVDALAAVADAAPGTLVVAADVAPAGAAAAVTGAQGADLGDLRRVARSLPVRLRSGDGLIRDYEDPRLMRERGTALGIEALDLPGKPDIVAGLPAKQAAALCTGRPPALPTTGASSALFALAAAVEAGPPVLVLALDQGSAASVTVTGSAALRRDEPEALEAPEQRVNPGPDLAISLAAYERAFEPKLRWEAGKCNACGVLAFPPRYRCLSCGAEDDWSLTPLPRRGVVYSVVTIHVPVPGLATPYSLVIVELDGTDVRALVQVTGTAPGSVSIEDAGELVLRRVAVRSGVPDYGYAFRPGLPSQDGVDAAGQPRLDVTQEVGA